MQRVLPQPFPKLLILLKTRAQIFFEFGGARDEVGSRSGSCRRRRRRWHARSVAHRIGDRRRIMSTTSSSLITGSTITVLVQAIPALTQRRRAEVARFALGVGAATVDERLELILRGIGHSDVAEILDRVSDAAAVVEVVLPHECRAAKVHHNC